MSWLHSWCGLVFGWLLFGILLTGSIAVFYDEITYWLTPEMRGGPLPERHQVMHLGWTYLDAKAPQSRLWKITLPTTREPFLGVSWRTAEGRTVNQRLDPETGAQIKRDSEGGSFYLKYHEGLHIDRDKNPLGLLVVGATGVAMLVACISGIIVHKRIFKDFFVLRPSASAQRSMLDLHNVLGVMALPFHLVMAYTGLVLLYWLYVPAAVQALYHGDAPKFRTEAITQEFKTVVGKPAGPAGLMGPDQVLERAELYLGPGKMAYVYVRDPHRANAMVEAYRMRDDQVSQQVNQVALNGVTGQEVRVLVKRSLPFRVQAFAAALHWVEWGGNAARWGYFLAGLISSTMVGMGLAVFVEKRARQARRPLAWLRVIGAVNVAAVGGLCVACIAYLWAERLISVSVHGRAAWSVAVFFWVWVVTAIHAGVRPSRRAWAEQFGLTAMLCLGAPFLGGLIVRDLEAADGVRVAVDLTLIGLGLVFAGMSAGLVLKRPASTVRGLKLVEA